VCLCACVWGVELGVGGIYVWVVNMQMYVFTSIYACARKQFTIRLKISLNTLQYTAPYCNAAPHYTTLHHTAPHCSTRHRTAPHCNKLQHTATTHNAVKELATRHQLHHYV